MAPLFFFMRDMCIDLSVKVRYRPVCRDCWRKPRVSNMRRNLKACRNFKRQPLQVAAAAPPAVLPPAAGRGRAGKSILRQPRD